ncbi:hypothetical protein GGI21_000925 [Coemansia aciculifera]|nr:hypothetical protein GGI21_000925 [Coemansia aciculifera]
MRATIHGRLLAIALAILCLVAICLAQNGGGGGDNTTPTNNSSSTPATTPESKSTKPTGSQSSTDTADKSRDGPTSSDSGSHSKPTDSASSTTDSVSNSPTPSFDSSYDITGLPGSAIMMTPNLMLIPTPMFVIGSNVTLGWKYSNDTLRPPKKVSICGKFPKDLQYSNNPAALCDWFVAVNISGALTNYTWNTVTMGAPGVAFAEDTGYLMYLYDSDFGPSNYVPGAGRIPPSQFWFNMYNSRYTLTNNGVPKGYNPSAAHSLSVQIWVVATVVALGILAVGA